jgi:hypothetical protein
VRPKTGRWPCAGPKRPKTAAKGQEFLEISCEIPQFEKQRPNKPLDGELFRPSLTIFPWRNHQNQLTHFVGVIKDITPPN